MTTVNYAPQATTDRKVILDCRGFDFTADAPQSITDTILHWVTSFPQPQAMHIYLPSSAPQVRRLQCTLQGLGCAVSRVTNFGAQTPARQSGREQCAS